MSASDVMTAAGWLALCILVPLAIEAVGQRVDRRRRAAWVRETRRAGK